MVLKREPGADEEVASPLFDVRLGAIGLRVDDTRPVDVVRPVVLEDDTVFFDVGEGKGGVVDTGRDEGCL